MIAFLLITIRSSTITVMVIATLIKMTDLLDDKIKAFIIIIIDS